MLNTLMALCAVWSDWVSFCVSCWYMISQIVCIMGQIV